MQKKDQIADLFKETLENYEAPVRSGLWEQVASKIETAPPVTPDTSIATQAVTGASKITGSLMSWIGGAVIVASVGTGIYFYQNRKSNPESNTPSQDNVELSVSVDETPVAANQNELSEPVKTPASATSSENGIKKTVTGTSQQPEKPVAGNENQTITDNSSDIPAETQNTENIPATENTNKNDVKPQSTEVVKGENHHSSTENTVIKPVIDAQPVSGKAPLQVQFSTPSSAIAEWQFGDGSETANGSRVQHIFTQPGNYLVTLKITDEKGVMHEEVKRIKVLADLNLTYSNVITPNGDGKNDEFSVKAPEGVDIEVSIFDSGGKLVHKFTGTENSWNGKINNIRDAESGTYFVVIFATGPNGEKNVEKVTLDLKR